MGYYTIQTGFSRGEISPDFADRQDFEGWQYALAKARNVLITPSAIQVRPGTTFIADVGGASLTYKIVKLQFSATLVFYAVIHANKIDFYDFFTDTLVQSLVTVFTDANVKKMKVVFFDQALILTSQDFFPQLVIYDVSLLPSPFVIKDYEFTFQPQFDFDPAAYGTSTFEIPAGGSGQTGATTLVDVISGSFTYPANFANGTFATLGGGFNIAGTAKITMVLSPTRIEIYNTSQIGDSSASAPLKFEGTSTVFTQPAFNSAPAPGGPPALVGGFQNRIIFASIAAAATAWWASVTADPTDFYPGTATDSDAIAYSINEQDVTNIHHLVNNQTIQFVTNNGLYAFSNAFVGGLTPSNVNLIAANKFEYDPVFEPLVYDKLTIGLLQGGKTLMGTQTSDLENYQNSNLSVMSTDLVRSPTDSTVFDGRVENLPTAAFFINSDGTLLQFQSLHEENVQGFSLSTTGTNKEDKYRNCVTVEDQLYFLIERNGRVLIEKMDFSKRLDSTVTQTSGTPFTVVTGLEHLEGRFVMALVTNYTKPESNIFIAESAGFVFMQNLLVENGQVILDFAVEKAIVGLFFQPEISPLEPLLPNSQEGSSFYQRKKRYQIKVSFLRSNGIEVVTADGQTLVKGELQFGDDTFFPIKPKTGISNFGLEEGWRESLSPVTITQTKPFNFTIKGVTQFVSLEDEA